MHVNLRDCHGLSSRGLLGPSSVLARHLVRDTFSAARHADPTCSAPRQHMKWWKRPETESAEACIPTTGGGALTFDKVNLVVGQLGAQLGRAAAMLEAHHGLYSEDVQSRRAERLRAAVGINILGCHPQTLGPCGLASRGLCQILVRLGAIRSGHLRGFGEWLEMVRATSPVTALLSSKARCFVTLRDHRVGLLATVWSVIEAVCD